MFQNLKYKPLTHEEMVERSSLFLAQMKTRRSVRTFSERSVPFEVIENIVMTAASAPSGANKQPWTFVIVSNPEVKRQIREAAEKEEKENYEHRFTREWLEDLNQFGTDWHKEFLEKAPYLLVLFKQVYGVDKEKQRKNYYVNESVGIASGFLLMAIHNAGLVALTHTPSPMKFLTEILNRPSNEKPFLLIPVGFPEEETKVPKLKKKFFREVAKVL
ncbi:MAG: nitroreductase family protein [Candidatus Marinimicrobia bacterium]|nr:nitroreductase family protein [Candidatus Neomarinimicrobiota bacterium]